MSEFTTPIPSWISMLRRTLGHDEGEHLHPGTPVYNHRRKLVERIESSWVTHLHSLIREDVLNGLYGRRKHFWDEMECLVVYELDAASYTSPQHFIGFELDDEDALSNESLVKLARHATWIHCPGFSGRAFCPVERPHSEVVAEAPQVVIREDLSSASSTPCPSMLSSPLSRTSSVTSASSSGISDFSPLIRTESILPAQFATMLLNAKSSNAAQTPMRPRIAHAQNSYDRAMQQGVSLGLELDINSEPIEAY